MKDKHYLYGNIFLIEIPAKLDCPASMKTNQLFFDEEAFNADI
ncbi:hypothetical protein [Methylobacter sp. S3L5C]|nr:hypothetical protein [Methylobacter sp. S3L5C]